MFKHARVTFLLLTVAGLAACDNAGGDAADVNSSAYTDPTEAISDGGVTPRFIEGNIPGNGGEVCADDRVNPDGAAWYGIKVDPPVGGSFGGFDVTLSDDGRYLAWASLSGNVMEAVVMKGGPDTFIYDYNPPLLFADSGLRSPDNDGGNVPEISHYTLCYTVADGGQGCSQGYWKNHPDSWTATGYALGQTVGSVFTGADPYAGTTLHDALSLQGGPGVDGAKRILLRQAVAALLNAAHPDVDFPRTAAEVVADVDAALASGDRPTILALATDLELENTLGCPLN